MFVFFRSPVTHSLWSTPPLTYRQVRTENLAEEELEKALQEAEVLRKMSHSNIIRCMDSFIDQGMFCIVTDFADGGDLHGAIQRRAEAKPKRPFAEPDVMGIFVQLCLALQHVHKLKILHRDLKSQNVFLTQQGMVKLGDFGIAKQTAGTLDLAQTCIGTPYYLSPEIYEDKPYGKKSDIWSMGVILFELCALELPFQAKSLAALARKVLTGSPKALES